MAYLQFAFSLNFDYNLRRGNLRQKKSTLGEHLALLSVKYNIYPNEVFQALISARNNEKAVCGNLTVEYRGKVKGETIFLITKDSAVVAQFRVGEEFLPVSYTHLRAHETGRNLVCRLLL